MEIVCASERRIKSRGHPVDIPESVSIGDDMMPAPYAAIMQCKLFQVGTEFSLLFISINILPSVLSLTGLKNADCES